MLSFSPAVRIFLYAPAVDLRKSFDGLSGIISQAFPEEDLLSGHLFLFLNKRRDRIKLLYWDDGGLAIWYKRLEAGSFQLPSQAAAERHGRASIHPARHAPRWHRPDFRSSAETIPKAGKNPGNSRESTLKLEVSMR